jgi:iron complex outermembrane receptor protein
MTSRFVFRMSLVALGVSAALGANSAWAQDAGTPPPSGTEGEVEDMGVITVTGSRTITEAVRSPTPVTSVDIGAISVTTPSDTADALNKLPNIIGGRTPRTQGNGGTNNGGNVLSLRNFGVSRTLVLLDGKRVAPNNQDGTVNIDVLPQMLMERVDIVTGGASAVYGSDAVAGVVNFVLDKDFTGFSFKSDYGKSKYGDGDEYQLGAAWGTTLFNDRGHFEIAARTRHQDMIPQADRPYGENGQAWILTGGGTPTNPFQNTPYARIFNSAETGNVNCGALNPCGRNNYTFRQPGILSPLVHGTPATPGNNIEIGGDGGYVRYGTFRSEVEMKDVFTRFSLDLGDSANWYVQGSWAQAENASDWINWVVSPNPGRPNTIFADNPYLHPDTQLQMGSTVNCAALAGPGNNPLGWRCLGPSVASPTGGTPPTGATPTTPPSNVPYFSVPAYYFNRVDGIAADQSPNRMYRTLADQKNWNVETGVTGEIGSWSWDVYGSHSESELNVTNPNNTDNAKYLAALDAVNDGGTIRCWVSTQPQYASLYPGCVPINITNPNGASAAAYDYLRTSTGWTLTQEMENVGASIGGGLWGFGLPAGEIVANLSVDARWSTYVMESNAFPSDFVNCTGLRMCLANGGAPLRWVQNTNAEVDAKNHVYEAALEFNVPLLKEVTGFQDLSTNFAGRWSKYSTFDAVESWKIGLNWQIIDSLRFRSTLSSDIRAPNLNDLFQPPGVTSTGFTDRLTNTTAQGMRLVSRGNPNLTPEEAKTFTAGIVVTPTFLPRFSFAVDFYETRLTNAIIQASYQSDAIQAVCTATAPLYNSPACDLAVRPITDPTNSLYTTAANLPTEIRNSPVNAALVKTRGFDAQIDYSWEMGAGQFAFRHLASYQPTNSQLTTPLSTFYVWAVQPKLMQTTMLSFENSGWNFALQNRWLSSVSLKSSDNRLNGNTQNYRDSSLDSYNVVDTTISKGFEVSGGNMEAFLTVNNLLNEHAPLFPSNSGLPGLFYPTLGFYDDMGRFYTAGIKLKF